MIKALLMVIFTAVLATGFVWQLYFIWSYIFKDQPPMEPSAAILLMLLFWVVMNYINKQVNKR